MRMHKPRENIWISKLPWELFTYKFVYWRTIGHNHQLQLDKTHGNCNWKNKLIKFLLFIRVVFAFYVLSLYVKFWYKDNSQNCTTVSQTVATFCVFQGIWWHYSTQNTVFCSWDTNLPTDFVSGHSKIRIPRDSWSELKQCTLWIYIEYVCIIHRNIRAFVRHALFLSITDKCKEKSCSFYGGKPRSVQSPRYTHVVITNWRNLKSLYWG